MRVLHVYRTYFPDPPGGLQEAIRQICLATQPLGIENTVFTLSPSPRPTILQRPEARVVRCRSYAAPASCDLGGPEAAVRFAALAREADVIHYLFPWPFADLLAEIVRPTRPSVLTYVSDIVRQKRLLSLYEPLLWRSLRRADVIVANSPGYVRTSPYLSAADFASRIRVVPLGIGESSDAQKPDAAIVRRLLPDAKPFFLFLGVLRYYKGLDYLVEAAALCGARVVVAGEGPERARLESLAAARGADVVFAGFVEDREKAALIDAALALVLPSHLRSEAFGMVLVEAAMRGKPLVSTELGTGTSFVNEHETSGLVVPPADADTLARALRRLADEPETRARLGAGARRRYEAMFSDTQVGTGYADAFEVARSRYEQW